MAEAATQPAPAVAAGEARGVVFDVERYATHDGPGTRTTVFLKGCFLACAWCHNPESEDPRPELLFDADRCLGCLACVDACRHGALYLVDAAGAPLTADAAAARRGSPAPLAGRTHDRRACRRCGACVEACYPGALEMAGRVLSVQQVWEQVAPDRPFYARSGGGVTVSGGEPLRQPDFALALLRRFRVEGVHTALDTTAFGRWPPLAAAAAWADLVLLDLKAMDPAVHRRWTGVDNATILANAERLAALLRARHDPPDGAGETHGLWVRLPLIPGINDDDGHLRAAAAFIATRLHGAVRVVELLGYHTLGNDKRRRLGRQPALPGVAPMAADALRRHGEALTARLASHPGGRGIAVRWR